MTEYQIYLVIAGVSTLLFTLKVVLMLVGGDADADVGDADFDTELDDGSAQTSFKVFSMQAVLAFLMGFGWMALIVRFEIGMARPISILIALAFGTLLMLVMAYMLKQMYALNHSPKFDITKAKGLTGTVYTKIPPKGKGEGQVKIAVDGREKILRATNLTESIIESFSNVEVQKVENDTLFVKPRT